MTSNLSWGIIRSAAKSGIPAYVRFMKTPDKCFWCSRGLNYANITKDHFWPLSKGGCDKVDNLVKSCEQCNHSKADADPIEYGIRRLLSKKYKNTPRKVFSAKEILSPNIVMNLKFVQVGEKYVFQFNKRGYSAVMYNTNGVHMIALTDVTTGKSELVKVMARIPGMIRANAKRYRK